MNSLPQADLSILSGGAVQKGLATLAKLFQEQRGHRVVLAFATAPVLRHKVEGLEASLDIVVAPVPMMNDFEKNGRVVGRSSSVIGSVKAGVVVRQSAPSPDISTPEAFKKEILSSESLVYNEGSSGIFVEKLLQRLGIAEEAKTKTRRFPDAQGVMQHLAHSKTAKEIGFGQITAILLHADQGIKLVGPLPKEIENITTYAAGISTRASAPELAEQFIRFLVSPAAKEAFKATGVD
jgi:molybdate transport system substrate-binding protein